MILKKTLILQIPLFVLGDLLKHASKYVLVTQPHSMEVVCKAVLTGVILKDKAHSLASKETQVKMDNLEVWEEVTKPDLLGLRVKMEEISKANTANRMCKFE